MPQIITEILVVFGVFWWVIGGEIINCCRHITFFILVVVVVFLGTEFVSYNIINYDLIQ